MNYQLLTKNKSFFNVHKLLEEKGIENSMFMLELMDPRLLDIDLDSPGSELQHLYPAIAIEAKDNMYYMLREVLKAPGGIHINLNIAKLAQAFLFERGISSWVTAPRQTGSTTFTNILTSLKYIDEIPVYFKFGPTTNILCDNIVNSASVYDTLLGHYQEQDKMILYLQLSHYINARFWTFDSKVTDPKSINKMPINMIKSIHFTDAEYVEGINEFYNNFKDAGFKGVFLFESVINDNAKETGALKILEKECVEWETWMFDCPEQLDPTKIYHIQYDYEDLGFGEDWFNLQCKLLNNDWDIIRREVLLQRK